MTLSYLSSYNSAISHVCAEEMAMVLSLPELCPYA